MLLHETSKQIDRERRTNTNAKHSRPNQETHTHTLTQIQTLETRLLSRASQINSQCTKNQHFKKLDGRSVANGRFGVAHYAGEVLYGVEGFLEKNRDTVFPDLKALLQSSASKFTKVRSHSSCGVSMFVCVCNVCVLILCCVRCVLSL